MAEEGREPARQGLAIGKLLLPLGVIVGALGGQQALRSCTGLSGAAGWLLGAPAGAVLGLAAAFSLLVLLNAALRLMRRR